MKKLTSLMYLEKYLKIFEKSKAIYFDIITINSNLRSLDYPGSMRWQHVEPLTTAWGNYALQL